MDHEQIFEAAFADPNNMAIDIPPADINKILCSGTYKVNPDLKYTRTQLWDMEVKKSYNPDQYLRHLLRPGSLEIFNIVKNGPVETLVRVTDQRTWLDPSKFTTVIEQIWLDHDSQRAFGIGVPEAEIPDGRKIVSGKEQPLFHVEHSATGPENAQVNVWQIVFLSNDEKLAEPFRQIAENRHLREFVEVHIREVLGEELVRK